MQNSALERCISHIEQRLGWGDAAHWMTQDFEDLSLRIQEQTGRTISTTTLKRLWGHVAYNSSPSRHSLDTLALFLGYPAWRDFTHALDSEASAPAPSPTESRAPVAPSASPRTASRLPYSLRYLAVTVVLLSLGFAVWAGLNSTPADPVLTEVSFQSRPVASGVPNTVIFDYDVGDIKADRFFIQQSWDEERRVLVEAEQQTYASIYYYPGFFNAKLLAGDRIIAEHPVHVTTEDWIALIDDNPTPTYLTDAFSVSDGALSVAPAWLQAHGHDATAEYQVLEYYNVRTFGALRTDGFSLDTALRRTITNGRYPCGRAEISVIGERGGFQIPLGAPGCVSELNLLLGMRYLEGTTNDLSAFGLDLSTWQRVQLDVKDATVRIQAGTNAPFTMQLGEDAGQVVGLRFQFEGAGAVDYVTLRGTDGTVVYDESF